MTAKTKKNVQNKNTNIRTAGLKSHASLPLGRQRTCDNFVRFHCHSQRSFVHCHAFPWYTENTVVLCRMSSYAPYPVLRLSFLFEVLLVESFFRVECNNRGPVYRYKIRYCYFPVARNLEPFEGLNIVDSCLAVCFLKQNSVGNLWESLSGREHEFPPDKHDALVKRQTLVTWLKPINDDRRACFAYINKSASTKKSA